MKKIVLTYFSAFLVLSAMAQYPDLSQYTISGIATTTFKYDCFLSSSCESKRQKRVTEVPPWIVGGGWRSYFFVDGRESNIWSSPKSLIDNSVIDLKNDAVGPFRAMYPHINDYQFTTYPYSNNWKRNYAGFYSAHYFGHPVQGTITLGFMHGENKNEVLSGSCTSGTYVQNTMRPAVTKDCNDGDTYSGPGKSDGWDAYHSILSAAWIPNNQNNNWGQGYFSNDIGPICWPNNGYVTSTGIKTTTGFRHPSSIIVGDYLYIFIMQGGSYEGLITETEGRKGGVKLIRVLKTESLDPSKYEIFYKDELGNVFWNPSLPAGFNKDYMLSFVSTPGPKSTGILEDYSDISDVVRFSVAKVKNKNYYVGLEQYRLWAAPSVYKLALRYSTDLMNWTDRYDIYTANSWAEGKLNYPVLLDKYGWSNTDVDEDDFYVVGTEHGPIDHVNKLHVYKYIPPPQDPPVECPPGVFCPTEKIDGAAMPVDASKANIENRMRSTIVTENKHAVYPNPTNGIFYVTFPQQSKLKSVRIFDQDSRVLYSKTISESFGNLNGSQKLDISSFQKGVYFVELVFHNERRISKIVKL
jgi:hypothetical protein